MAAQTIAAQVAELVGSTAPASLDDWGGDAVNKLYSLLPYDILAPFTTLESCDYGSGVSVVAVAQVSSATPTGTFPLSENATFTTVINGTSIAHAGLTNDSLATIITAIISAINLNAVVSPYVSASDGTTLVQLTAVTAGVEFSITTTCITSGGDNSYTNATVTANREEVTAYTELTTKNKKIYEVSRRTSGGLHRICEEISPEQYAGEYADSNSMYYPTDYDPKWSKYTNTIKVLPSASGMIVYARTLANVITLDTSATAITTLPYDAEYLVVLDLAGRVALNKIQGLATAVLTTALTVPATPTAPSFTYTAAAASSVSATTLSVTLTPPVSAPAFAATTAPAGLATALTAFDTAMTNEDTELAQEQIRKSNAYLQQYQNDIQKEAQRVSADIEVYKVSLQRNIKQAEMTLQEAITNASNITNIALKNAENAFAHDVQEYAAILKLYEAGISAYAQGVQTAVTVYQSNLGRLKSETERYLALIASFKSEYLEQLLTKYGIDLRPKGKN
jgi:hypothetical protein